MEWRGRWTLGVASRRSRANGRIIRRRYVDVMDFCVALAIRVHAKAPRDVQVRAHCRERKEIVSGSRYTIDAGCAAGIGSFSESTLRG